MKRLFETLGFSVQAEIDYIDLIAKKESDIVLVEMKNNLNLHVIAQAIERQTLTDYVYIGIKKPSSNVLNSKTHKDKIKILKRLSIGLIYVHQEAEIIFDPTVRPQIKKVKKRLKLLEAFAELKHNPNIGGSHHQKIMTLYRQQALTIGSFLLDGPMKVTEVRRLSSIEKTHSILYKNYYGWFQVESRGIYRLTENGYAAVNEFQTNLNQ
ncbi:MAG: hypothetical protein EOM23_11895 [Candidatus Moranbacteria bacterium]|nr:hypothetical protein [Candidatus Moranbacteria bacterium]